MTQTLLFESDYQPTTVTDDNVISQPHDNNPTTEIEPITWKIGNNLTEEQNMKYHSKLHNRFSKTHTACLKQNGDLCAATVKIFWSLV